MGGFISRILLGFASLVCSHAAFTVAHALGWFPDDQLARLLIASPEILQIEAVRWGLTAILAFLLWGVADHFLYRRHTRKTPRVRHREITATPSPAVRAGHAKKTEQKSELDWNFEREIAFIGMSAGAEQQILIHNFQARGKNLTNDPITNLTGFIRSDKTGEQFPLLFNLKGKATPLDQVTVPVAAIIDMHAAFSDDGKPISLRRFLSEMVPFTFFFEYDGKLVRRTVTPEEVEERINDYGKTIRQSLVRAPEATIQERSAKSERNLAALNKATAELSATMDLAMERMIFGTNDQDKIAKQQGPEVAWPDFDKWDKKTDFRLFEIACLWTDQEPSLPLTSEAARRFKVLEQAIWNKSLKIRSESVREAVVSAITISKGGKSKASPNWVISRDDLLLYAFGTNEQPRFLFPEERV